MTDHRSLRERLGAYVLGALDPAERHLVERHLDECGRCRDELARLSPLPRLLDRLDEHEVGAAALRAPPGATDRLVEAAAAQRRRERRRLRAWQGLTAAAAAAAVLVVWSPWDAPPPPSDALVAAAQPAATAVEGEAELLAWEWGTTVRLDVSNLPVRDSYLLWAVADDGRREQAGTWGPTADQHARVIGACSITRDRLARVEITDPAGEVLATFEPPAA